jgi:hypothetical protein
MKKKDKNPLEVPKDVEKVQVCVSNSQEHICPWCGRCKHCGQPCSPVIPILYPQPVPWPQVPPIPWNPLPVPYTGDPVFPPSTTMCSSGTQDNEKNAQSEFTVQYQGGQEHGKNS